MIALKDIGQAAAILMTQNWDGLRIVELEAKQRYCQTEITAALADAFGHDVKTNYVPSDEWESLFKSQGGQNPLPRIQMIDGSMKSGSTSRANRMNSGKHQHPLMWRSATWL